VEGTKKLPSLLEVSINIKVMVNISLLQAVEAPRVARGRGSHIT
jgi:hypothetical protein